MGRWRDRMDAWDEFRNGDESDQDQSSGDEGSTEVDADDDNDYAMCGPSITNPPADGMTGTSYCDARLGKSGTSCCHVTNLQYNDDVRETIAEMQEDYTPGEKSHTVLQTALDGNGNGAADGYYCMTSSSVRNIGYYQDDNGHLDYDFWGTQISLDMECPTEF